MCLKKTWNNIGIKKKLFIISTGIVVASAILIYITLYFLFPEVYTHTRIKNIRMETEKLITKMANDENYDYESGINKYSYENGAVAALLTDNGDVIYAPDKFERNILRDDTVVSELKKGIFKNNRSTYEFSVNAYVKSLNQNCILKVSVPLSSRKNIHKVIIILLPIILIITIILGLLSVWVYGKVISAPLLKINKVAKGISNLDFEKSLEVKGNDEFAELSNSINSISSNLEKNISMLEKANEKLKDDIEKEKLIDRRRRNFINAISHELKTPITVISGQIEGMIYSIGPYKDREKYLKESLESVKELNNLVHEIIDLAKIEEEKSVKKEKLEINKILLECLSGYEYFIKERNINIIINEDKRIVKTVDKSIMKKILSNIIGNSVKYSKSFIEIESGDTFIKIINDTSIILSNEDLDDIFKPFYRGDKSRNKDINGTGLGLYIVKYLVELHGDLGYKVEIYNDIFIFTLLI
ncbi:MAG: HAMP domain-containing sensor histidine kinase [Clostridium sp.]|uniref:HAMP domain-containing sensor histidine kinase n=1 Tax=Clostridium sp. TaxID=1506 RepID=UPI003EE6F662